LPFVVRPFARSPVRPFVSRLSFVAVTLLPSFANVVVVGVGDVAD